VQFRKRFAASFLVLSSPIQKEVSLSEPHAKLVYQSVTCLISKAYVLASPLPRNAALAICEYQLDLRSHGTRTIRLSPDDRKTKQAAAKLRLGRASAVPDLSSPFCHLSFLLLGTCSFLWRSPLPKWWN
jgi:hypothetical protein